jgi:transcriptional regulator with XRE-family HTH domain
MPKRTTGNPSAAIASVNAQIGKRIRARRMQLGMSQTDVADKIGVGYQWVQKWESGQGYARAACMPLIAEVLGVPVGFFFGTIDQAAGVRATVETIGLLGERGAHDLLAAYGAMDAHQRRTFLGMAREVAKANAARTSSN